MSLGKILMAVGAVIFASGLLMWILTKPGSTMPSRLPGDLKFQKGGLTVYFPIATSILLSLLLTGALALVTWIMRSRH